MKAGKVAISLPIHLLEQVRCAAEKNGTSLSAWLAEAAAARLRNEGLGELLDEWDSKFGPPTDEQMAQAEAELGVRPPARQE